MRFRDPKRLRIISGASVLLLLTGLPVMVGLSRFLPDASTQPPGIMATYATGLTALGGAVVGASVLSVLFIIWHFINQRRNVGRKYLMQRSRRRRNLVEDARSLAIILGVTGLIIGSLAGLYASMMHARPDMVGRLPLPHLTGELAITCLFVGALLYISGRFDR
jgi:protein-S-isoprenylcysteine O-methyltransferase Ste14